MIEPLGLALALTLMSAVRRAVVEVSALNPDILITSPRMNSCSHDAVVAPIVLDDDDGWRMLGRGLIHNLEPWPLADPYTVINKSISLKTMFNNIARLSVSRIQNLSFTPVTHPAVQPAVVLPIVSSTVPSPVTARLRVTRALHVVNHRTRPNLPGLDSSYSYSRE